MGVDTVQMAVEGVDMVEVDMVEADMAVVADMAEANVMDVEPVDIYHNMVVQSRLLADKLSNMGQSQLPLDTLLQDMEEVPLPRGQMFQIR